MTPQWNATLEQALLVELQAAWLRLNRSVFNGALLQPVLQLHDSRQKLGFWHSPSRTLSLSRAWVQTSPWGQVIEVIKHEMAHQFVSEILKESQESPHGPAFRSVCARFHIDDRAMGLPKDPNQPEPKAISRIRKLLALAQSPNENEARVALNQARRLMTAHEKEWSQRDRPVVFQFHQIGLQKGRFDPWEKSLAGLLAEHFFVHAIWVPVYDAFRGRTVRTLEINGRPEAVQVAEYTHIYLVHIAESLWKTHQRTHQISTNKERRTFLLGVMMGFAQSLDKEQVRCEQEGLVAAKDRELNRWFRVRYPHIRTRRGSSIRGSETLKAGQSVGRAIQLRDAIEKRRGLLRRLLG